MRHQPYFKEYGRWLSNYENEKTLSIHVPSEVLCMREEGVHTKSRIIRMREMS